MVARTSIMQLVQARDGRSQQDAKIAFSLPEIETLHARLPELEGKTALQKNPHPPETLAWAAWIIAKLGGWDGYPKSKPPESAKRVNRRAGAASAHHTDACDLWCRQSRKRDTTPKKTASRENTGDCRGEA
ncbi:hypothetical protein [Pararhodobacter sp.]|uniref:hypothetical protein n=1 Tax=Pararhodobacter sp. TaxID=2127056 RepID=UPI002AFEC05D|nr:hypothetical protein [Pararhodobacter sp.]